MRPKLACADDRLSAAVDAGTLIANSTPQEMGAMMRDEAKNMAELVKAPGLQVK